MGDEYRKTTKFVCKECGKEWDTPGGVQICHHKDRIVSLLEDVDNHKNLALSEVVDYLADIMDAGELDYEYDSVGWKPTPDDKYRDAEATGVSVSQFKEFSCPDCGKQITMALEAEDWMPRWLGECTDCGWRYSAKPTEFTITRSDSNL